MRQRPRSCSLPFSLQFNPPRVSCITCTHTDAPHSLLPEFRNGTPPENPAKLTLLLGLAAVVSMTENVVLVSLPICVVRELQLPVVFVGYIGAITNLSSFVLMLILPRIVAQSTFLSLFAFTCGILIIADLTLACGLLLTSPFLLLCQATWRGMAVIRGPLTLLWIGRNAASQTEQSECIKRLQIVQMGFYFLGNPAVAFTSSVFNASTTIILACAVAGMNYLCILMFAMRVFEKDVFDGNQSTVSTSTSGKTHSGFMLLQVWTSFMRGLSALWLRDLNSVLLAGIYNLGLSGFGLFSTVATLLTVAQPPLLCLLLEHTGLRTVLHFLCWAHCCQVPLINWTQVRRPPALWACLAGQVTLPAVNNMHGMLFNILALQLLPIGMVAVCTTLDYVFNVLGSLAGGVISSQICGYVVLIPNEQYVIIYVGCASFSLATALVNALNFPNLEKS